MPDYCLFTVEHSEARRIYVRGIADITEPIDNYDKIIKFYHGSKLKPEPPPNPFEKETVEHKLYEELLSEISSKFEDLGDELIFADEKPEFCKYLGFRFYIEKQKVIV